MSQHTLLPTVHNARTQHNKTWIQNRVSHLDGFIHQVAQIFTDLFCALLPSFLLRNYTASDQGHFESTEYLSGLRGVVAVLVYIRNFSSPYHPSIDYSYGQNGDYSLARLPVIRVIYSGPWVPVMFIVSGYVLALKPLRTAVHRAPSDRLVGNLARTLFHRPLKLFLPPLLSTLVLMISVNYHICDVDNRVFTGEIILPHARPTLLAQGADWARDLYRQYFNIWSWRLSPPTYGPHLWTIPVQFRGSLLLVLVFIVLSRLRRSLWSLALLILITVSLLFGRWDAALFLGGAYLCVKDMSVTESPYQIPDEVCEETTHRTTLIKPLLWFIYTMVALWIGSVPRKLEEGGAWGFDWMRIISSDYAMWDALSGFMVVHALSISNVMFSSDGFNIQSIFIGPVPRYLGQISYSLYIVHHNVNVIIGARVASSFWLWTGQRTAQSSETGFILGLLFTLPILIWLADIHWRAIEKPCSRISGWLEETCFERV